MKNSDRQLARQAALEAGRQLRVRREQWNAVTADFAHDVKLQADCEAENIILKLLMQNSSYPVLTEEAGEFGALEGAHDLRWIVDPLDGTVNYAKGTPLSAVSIGLCRGSTPVYGVIYDFWREELFCGGPDSGAFLNEKPINVSNVTDKCHAVLATGFPSASDFGEESLRHFLCCVQQFRKIRLFGSAALSLAYVACGRVDAYIEDEIMLWDVSAGTALVAGAGGHFTIKSSERTHNACRAMSAATRELGAELSKL